MDIYKKAGIRILIIVHVLLAACYFEHSGSMWESITVVLLYIIFMEFMFWIFFAECEY